MKVYCLILCCSWSSAVPFSPLRSLPATEVLQGLETSMISVGRVMPFLPVSQGDKTRQGTRGMENREYQELEREINERGVRFVNHSPYSPHKTGRVERKASNLKAMLNSKPVSCYSSAMSTMVISPNDMVFPSQSSMHCTDLDDFPEERTLWQALYFGAARRRNKEHQRETNC